jgi:hypothetical protein
MNIWQCEEYAKEHGFDSVKFTANFPVGQKQCEWLDAYFGMFKVDGIEGFLMTRSIGKQFPNLTCKIIEG